MLPKNDCSEQPYTVDKRFLYPSCMKIWLPILLISLTFTLSCQTSTTDQPARDTHRAVDKELPPLSAYVNDYARVLTQAQQDTLNTRLAALEDSVGSQLVILTVDSLGGHTIEEYSLRVAEHYGIGRADYDDGVLILLALQDQQVRIEVGYGLELIIRDEIARQIIEDRMTPNFRAGNFYEGLTAGATEIIRLIYQHPELVGKK